MYRIKQTPEDFVVKEINKLEFDENGQYSYYLLKKTNYNTVDAVKRVCSAWKIRDKFVNFAGTKDKVAVTEQYISINKGPQKNLKLKDLELKFLGKGLERLNLGSLQGNEFEIVVRNIEKKPKENRVFVNYFDSQRFGINKNNHIIGKLIVKNEYKSACDLIPETKVYLQRNSTDFIGALRSIPRKTLKLYVHAYQSHLWNIVAEKIAKSVKENIKLPIIGFGTEFEDKKTEKTYGKIMEKENITLRDFINRKIPELSEEGTIRDLFVTAKNFKVGKIEADDLNKGKKKVKLKFSLLPGAYATNVIKHLFE